VKLIDHLSRILVFAFGIPLSAHAAPARSIVSLDRDWAFFQGDAPGAEKPGLDDSAWRKLDVPHDWSIEGEFKQSAPTTGTGGWLPSGVAWYRKSLEIPAVTHGRRFWVEFDGVMANSEVWINGHSLGRRPNGYVSFRHDLTDQLKPGAENLLVVKTDTSAQPASRWYSGAGIYRHVRLVSAHPAHVEPWGVFITTPDVSETSATVNIQTSIENLTQEPAKITLRSTLVAPDGKTISSTDSDATLAAGQTNTTFQQIQISKPQLWNLESPQLHTLVTRIMSGETVLDEVSTPFGIRAAVFDSKTGFSLNGKNFKLKGVCLHHDGGAVGAAVPLAVWERRLKRLQELGVNAIRTAHNPPAPEFLDLCDRMGMLVMLEFFDCWTKGKNPHDYHLFFKQWAHTDLREGVLRDRNHPSVILYSVGNEIHDTPKPDIAKPILRGLVDICHELDPTRPVTQGLFRPNVSGDYENGLADMLDVIGTNYRDQELLEAWKAKPGRKIVGTEQGHERSTWLACRDHPQHSGQFLWVGIDYLGESRSWPLTVFNAGLLDRAGFVQPRGFERQSWWSEKPMVRALRRIGMTAATPADPGYENLEWKRRQVLFHDWTPENPGAQDENVEIYSNAQEVELFLNEKSLGKKATRKDAGSLNWKIPYQPGTLKAVAFIGGKEVANDTLRTAGKPSKLAILADQPTLGTGFDEVAHLEINLLDENGTLVPSADDLIQFNVSGPGKIIAVDSGSVVSIERFQANQRQAFQGRALAILRATAAGEITVTATVDGLPSATVQITGQP
jgi:beta-galactosidase